MFRGAFNASSELSGLKSLAVDGDPGGPRAGWLTAADALYDTACEISWLRWMVEPGNIWVQRAFAMGMFAVPMGAAVAAELRQRKATPKPKPQGAPPPEPVRDPGEPEGPRSGYVHEDMAAIRPDGGKGDD